MLDLYRDLGSNAFPTTNGKDNIIAKKLKSMHHQKSHMRITEEAHDYLLKRLEGRFEEYGYIEI